MEPPPPPAPAAKPKFPRLAVLPPSTQRWTFQAPAKRIHNGPDVAHFLTSKAYRDICVFVLQLNRALCPRRKPDAPTAIASAAASSGAGLLARPAAAAAATACFTLASRRDDPPSVRRLQGLLEKLAALVDEAPPDPGPRRFGNVAFRAWHALLAERADALLDEALAPEVLGFGGRGGAARTEAGDDGDDADKAPETKAAVSAKEELKAYFLGGFGSSQRLDYGTGHELSFVAFLGGLWKLGAFSDAAISHEGDIERSIVLGVIEPYLKVVRKLILTYTLEPAGSHGVWGLDDHSFVPYIFGSAQLTRPISESEPMPLEGSAPRAPKPGDILKPETVEVQRELNMYFSAVGFINDVKKGPFWEHSPILFDVSGIKDGWGKINKGMIKMFNAEVLSKFPVVQHFPFGSLFEWDADPDAPPPATSVHMANQPTADAAAGPGGQTGMPPPGMMPPMGGGGTAAPWAQTGRMPGPPGVGGAGVPYSARPGVPSVRGGRPPPPDPVERQGVGLGASSAAPPGDSTGPQISLTKAPWARSP